MTILLVAGAFAGGYAAAVLTWDRAHAFLVGAEARLQQLREQARAIERQLRG